MAPYRLFGDYGIPLAGTRGIRIANLQHRVDGKHSIATLLGQTPVFQHRERSAAISLGAHFFAKEVVHRHHKF